MRDGLMLVKGHLLTTNGWKIKEKDERAKITMPK